MAFVEGARNGRCTEWRSCSGDSVLSHRVIHGRSCRSRWIGNSKPMGRKLSVSAILAPGYRVLHINTTGKRANHIITPKEA